MSRSKHNHPKPAEPKQSADVPDAPERPVDSQRPADNAGESPSRTPMERPIKPPKRVRFGLKLTATDEVVGRTEVAGQWLKTLSGMIDEEGRQEGLTYARQGQTISMEITPGLLSAQVQGRRGRPYTVTLQFATLDQTQWNTLINALAGTASHVAKVLAGELPESFTDLLDSLKLHPARDDAEGHVDDDEDGDGGDGARRTILGRPRASCPCGYHRPCKHAAAVGYLLAEQLNDQPLIAMTLLGMSWEQVKEHLRQRRVMKTQGVASAHPDQLAGLAQSAPLPLEACVEEFWRYGPQLSELEQAPLPHHVPHALLRRLGPSPLRGRFPMVGLLASVYDTVSQSAIELRDRAEGGNGP